MESSRFHCHRYNTYDTAVSLSPSLLHCCAELKISLEIQVICPLNASAVLKGKKPLGVERKTQETKKFYSWHMYPFCALSVYLQKQPHRNFQTLPATTQEILPPNQLHTEFASATSQTRQNILISPGSPLTQLPGASRFVFVPTRSLRARRRHQHRAWSANMCRTAVDVLSLVKVSFAGKQSRARSSGIHEIKVKNIIILRRLAYSLQMYPTLSRIYVHIIAVSAAVYFKQTEGWGSYHGKCERTTKHWHYGARTTPQMLWVKYQPNY